MATTTTTGSPRERASPGALPRKELVLHFQPVVSLTDDRLDGFEALVRWAHRTKGLIGPDELLPELERTGCIGDLGSWVVEESSAQLSRWHAAFPGVSARLALNVSVAELRHGLVDALLSAAGVGGIDPSHLTVEMREGTVVDGDLGTANVLRALKATGVKLSIDEFGTGYSSLGLLHRLPIDEIKIARQFIAGLPHDPVRSAIVATIVTLAHAMDLSVVAVGVETAEQLERLRALGCDKAQGFLYARPGSASDMDDVLAAAAAGQACPVLGSIVTASSAGLSALVIDCDREDRLVSRLALASSGFTVIEAGTLAAGLRVACRVHPDVIVIDTALPDGGVHGIAQLRAETAPVPVAIVATGSSSAPADRAEAFLAGAHEYVVKPLAPRDLVARVRDALRSASSARPDSRPDALHGILDAARQRDAALAASDLVGELSPRQIDIVRRLVSGQRVPAIARELYVSQSTVRNHLSAIFHRFGVCSQQELCDAVTRPWLAESSRPSRRSVRFGTTRA